MIKEFEFKRTICEKKQSIWAKEPPKAGICCQKEMIRVYNTSHIWKASLGR